MNFASVGISQELSFPLTDAQKILKNEKECDLDRKELELRKQQDSLKDQRIANLEKELELAKREIDIKDRINTVKDMEIEAQKRAFADMKEVTDRAIKLVEVSKPKSNFQLLGLAGLAVFLAGIIVGK